MGAAPDLSTRLKVRAGYLQRARGYFAGQSITEVESPIVTAHAVTDPHIDSLRCLSGDNRIKWLRPSPEYHLKRLLAAGSGDIFEIGKVFRDGESGSRHHPEFTMVEWYRLGFDLQDIIDDTIGLIKTLGSTAAHPPVQVDQIRYDEAFKRHLSVDPITADATELAAVAESLMNDEMSEQLKFSLGNNRGMWLDLLMSHCLEPLFNNEALTVITHYPADQASLARLCPDDPRFAERFEVYYRGIELANGFKELRDAAEQRQRFEQDQATRKEFGKTVHAIDESFLQALEQGLPDCSGVAVGLDRIIMACEGYGRISDTLSLNG